LPAVAAAQLGSLQGPTGTPFQLPLNFSVGIIVDHLDLLDRLLIFNNNVLCGIAKVLQRGQISPAILQSLVDMLYTQKASGEPNDPNFIPDILLKILTELVRIHHFAASSLIDLVSFLRIASHDTSAAQNSTNIVSMIINAATAQHSDSSIVLIKTEAEQQPVVTDTMDTLVEDGDQMDAEEDTDALGAQTVMQGVADANQSSTDSNSASLGNVDFTALQRVLQNLCQSAGSGLVLLFQCIGGITSAANKSKSTLLTNCIQASGPDIQLLMRSLLNEIAVLPPLASIAGTPPHAADFNAWSELFQINMQLVSALSICNLLGDSGLSSGTCSLAPIISVNQSLVLTNAVMRKLQSFVQQGILAACNNPAYKQADMLAIGYSSMMCLATGCNALIDLHSSDDSALLAGYSKMNIQSQLSTILQSVLKPAWKDMQYMKRIHVSADSKGSVLSEYGNYIDGVVINLREFLKYKKSFSI
jgi:hypothetical protein